MRDVSVLEVKSAVFVCVWDLKFCKTRRTIPLNLFFLLHYYTTNASFWTPKLNSVACILGINACHFTLKYSDGRSILRFEVILLNVERVFPRHRWTRIGKGNTV